MRFRKIVVALAIAAVAAVAAVPAFAADSDEVGTVDAATQIDWGTNPDPQTTNVPYLAWLGNTVKISKCLPFIDSISDAQVESIRLSLNLSVSFPGTYLIEDWTGVDENNAGPGWLNGAAAGRNTTVPVEVTRRGICWTAQAESNKAGLAVIKLAVSVEALASLKATLGESASLVIGLDNVALYREILVRHQFLAIWMTAKMQPIKEISATEPGGKLEHGSPVGDPTGNGIFQPPFDLKKYDGDISNVFGVVKSTVKGTFPTGNDFAGIFKDNLVTLPDQWSDLAHKLAIDDSSASGSAPGSAYMRWDIHDDTNLGHPLGGDDSLFHSDNASCNTGDLEGLDAVDNCRRGDEDGPFSRVNGAAWPTIGPFDPLFPNQTLLNNGVLDSGDAPMPPLRVDFGLSANSIGAFDKADKDDVYDIDNTRDQRHDLYAPFYKAYIPAAGLFGRSGGSGVAGAFANNFVGFIEGGRYDYWNIYPQAWRDGYNHCNDPQGNAYPLPTGPSQVSVYTDEHGEAFVKFLPYVGNYLTPDSQSRCNVKPGLYGEADITATGFYPDQQPLYTTPGSTNTLHKVANQLANKTLSCVRKPNTGAEAFCVEKIVDWNGDPMSKVKVRFSTSGQQGEVSADAIKTIPPYNTTDQTTTATDPTGQNTWVEIVTGANGQAGIAVLNSNGCTDVTSKNLYSAYSKDLLPVTLTQKIDTTGGAGCTASTENPTEIVGLGTGGGTGTGEGTTPPVTPPAGGGSSGGSSSGGSSSGGAAATASTVVSLGGPVIQATPVLSATQSAVVAQVSARLFSVKVLQTQLGRYLVVNVKGTAKTAKIRIQIMGKNGKVMKTITRTVPTNKAFKIANYKLPKTVASVRASVTA